MNFLGTKRLETKRLILRRFKLGDEVAMFNNWANDDEVTRFLQWETHKTMADSKSIISEWVKEYENPEFFNWAITLKDNPEEVLGNVGVIKLNKRAELVETGYVLSKRLWSKGIMTEVYTEVLRFLFEEVGVNKVQTKHDLNNPASGKVMAKCGLKKEGVLRQSDFNNLGICDLQYYGLLKSEYFGR